MGRQAKVWRWKARNSYYTTIDGKQVNLGPDKDNARATFHRLMSEKRGHANTSDPLVSTIIDLFLEWLPQHRSPATYQWYESRLRRFTEFHKHLLVSELKPHHVQRWADSNPTHSSTTRRNSVQSVKGALKWAKLQGYVESNPIADMSRPNAEARDDVITPDEFKNLLSFVRDENFRSLLVVAYETGARPTELFKVEARHVDLQRSRWKFERTEAKSKKQIRFVYLSDNALRITRNLMHANPDGPLFRNTKGQPWNKGSCSCQFARLRRRMAKATMLAQGMEVSRKKLTRQQVNRYAKRFCLYLCRHSFATNALNNGLDVLTVATLLGHKDPSMIARVYAHLNHNPDRLLEQ